MEMTFRDLVGTIDEVVAICKELIAAGRDSSYDYENEHNGNNEFTITYDSDLKTLWVFNTEFNLGEVSVSDIETVIRDLFPQEEEIEGWVYWSGDIDTPVKFKGNALDIEVNYSAFLCGDFKAYEVDPIGPKYVLVQEMGEGYGYGSFTDLVPYDEYIASLSIFE